MEIRAAVPVEYDGKELLGGTLGTFANRAAVADGALFMLPALDGSDETLSSTRLRQAVAAMATAPEAHGEEPILAQHGYSAASLARLLHVATQGVEQVRGMVESGKTRQEWIVP